MRKVKYLIIGLIIVIIIVVISIVSALSNKSNEDEKPESNHYNQIISDDATQQMISERSKLHEVDNVDDFFEVVNCINQYLGAVNKNILNDYSGNDASEMKKSMQVNIYNILSQEYVADNNITENNVFDYVDDIDSVVLFYIPLKMNVLESEDESTKRYVAYGIEEDIENNYIKDLYIIVNVDQNNRTFSIEPIIDKQYNDINEINIENKAIEITKNDNNQIAQTNINDEYVSQKYLDYYKKL